jgi:purine-binding chemotaxis protein CheW
MGMTTRDRLKRIESRRAGSSLPDQMAIDDVYRRRASQLAERKAAGPGLSTCAVLVFGLGAERYAIELSELAEVFPYRGCTAVPGAPPALIGVLNVRGEIRSVVDLRRVLELPPCDDSTTGYVLMLRQPGRAVGFKVDRVDHVRQIDPAELVSANDAKSVPGSRFVKALTADTLILIDTTATLSSLGLATI